VAVTTSRRLLIAAAALWITAAVAYVVLEALAAAAVPSYSYTRHYISALGVPEWSPRASLMNAAFYQQAALFLGGAVLAIRAIHGRWLGALFLLFTATNAVGNVLVALVHGGSPLWKDGHEYLHGVGASLAIGGGNAAVLAGTMLVGRVVSARWYRPVGVLIGLAGFATLAMLQNYVNWAVVDYAPLGLIERACVYTIMIWQAFTGIVLLTRPRRDDVAATRTEESADGRDDPGGRSYIDT
jgi:hypothetical membrane protein